MGKQDKEAAEKILGNCCSALVITAALLTARGAGLFAGLCFSSLEPARGPSLLPRRILWYMLWEPSLYS